MNNETVNWRDVALQNPHEYTGSKSQEDLQEKLNQEIKKIRSFIIIDFDNFLKFYVLCDISS